MSNSEGFNLDAKKLQTFALIIGLSLSIYQGSSFISNQVTAVEALQVSVGRITSHIDKIDEQLTDIKSHQIVVDVTVSNVAEMKQLVKELEKAVLEIQFEHRKK